ncbi:hypothetical protein AB838_07130 [Rhodobacteraceae bacterium (ex Bugula neritina AB1)]|nr:hypothetical protein AB838_07130 [Rhodobacteraceae bacterium (ex Bugula neritina AB1)]
MNQSFESQLKSLGSYRGGILAASMVGLSAMFLSDHYGAPSMLMALLLGLALNFLYEDAVAKPGIEFSARTILRMGVALLGLRVSWQLLSDLGLQSVTVVVAGMLLTILFGVALSRLIGRGLNFGILTGGSVAICGASAAMAIAAILPRNDQSNQNLTFTVVSVTLLSTLAMIFYPMVAELLIMDTTEAGLFLGGTIHDVAQVVGAGYSMSDETGDVSTVVKLLRVSCLAPIVVFLTIFVRWNKKTGEEGQAKTPVLPFFVIGFLALALVNSLVPLPDFVITLFTEISRFFLLIAIAAVGMKTSLGQIRDVGGQAILLVVAETAFLALLILSYILWAA